MILALKPNGIICHYYYGGIVARLACLPVLCRHNNTTAWKHQATQCNIVGRRCKQFSHLSLRLIYCFRLPKQPPARQQSNCSHPFFPCLQCRRRRRRSFLPPASLWSTVTSNASHAPPSATNRLATDSFDDRFIGITERWGQRDYHRQQPVAWSQLPGSVLCYYFWLLSMITAKPK